MAEVYCRNKVCLLGLSELNIGREKEGERGHMVPKDNLAQIESSRCILRGKEK